MRAGCQHRCSRLVCRGASGQATSPRPESSKGLTGAAECRYPSVVMDDLKKLTVRHLRELARKHLGSGRSKLKTKGELIAALKGLVRSFKRDPPEDANPGRRASKGAASAKVVKPAPAAPAPKAARTLVGGVKRGTRAKVTAFSRDQQSAAPILRNEGTGPGIAPQRKAEPLIEGFFVARIAGEHEA